MSTVLSKFVTDANKSIFLVLLYAAEFISNFGIPFFNNSTAQLNVLDPNLYKIINIISIIQSVSGNLIAYDYYLI